MKRIFIFLSLLNYNPTINHAADLETNPIPQKNGYQITIEVVNDSYSDFWAAEQYLQYSPEGKTALPKQGTSKTFIVNWGGFTYKDFWEYWDTGWKDSDGNWWRPSGSVYVWNDYGDFERNGKTGMCLFEPDWNRDVKEGGVILDKKDFSKEYNKVIIHLLEGFPHPESYLEYTTV